MKGDLEMLVNVNLTEFFT